MPHRLKSQFIQTFTEGAINPSKRPSLQDWNFALNLYREEIKKGWHETAMRPDKPKDKAYRGAQSV